MRNFKFILLMCLSCTGVSQAQELYRGLQHEHHQWRPGGGVHAGGFTGASASLFKGHFCSATNLHITDLSLELLVGVYPVETRDNEITEYYRAFSWGFQAYVAVFSWQMREFTLGVGLSPGIMRSQQQTSLTTALRAEVTGRLFRIGNNYFSLAGTLGLKASHALTDRASWLGPEAGVILRKTR